MTCTMKRMSQKQEIWARFGLVALALALLPFAAHAAGAGAGLQWEGPLANLSASISGPVAFAVALMGIVVTGAALVFGGEMNEFVRRMVMLILVISVVGFAGNLLTNFFGITASVPVELVLR